LTGAPLCSIDADVYARYYEMVRRYLGSKTAEIVSPNSHDYRINFTCVSAAVVFLLSLPADVLGAKTAVDVCRRFFRYFTLD
jgi:hypothetical protein